MIYAGVDIAKTDHVIGAVDERGAETCPPMPFKNAEAGLERAVAWLEGLAGSPSASPCPKAFGIRFSRCNVRIICCSRKPTV